MAKHREFEQEVTVYVWRYEGEKRPGHAAVKLRGGTGRDGYISWWPQAGGVRDHRKVYQGAISKRDVKDDMVSEISELTQIRLREGQFTPRPGQVVVRTYLDYDHEANLYGRQADEKIKLPGLGQSLTPYGLDIERMLQWWRVFCACPHPRYKFASKTSNCAAVAAAALRAGGADQFHKPPSALLFLDPNQIAAWTHKLRAAIDRKNEPAKRLAVELQQHEEPPQLQSLPDTGVISYEAWMQISNKDMGKSLIRSDMVKKIDHKLKAFHAIKAFPHDPGFNAKLEKLGEVMDAVHYYLSHKTGSKRSDAVLLMGRQILGYLRKLNTSYPNMINKDWFVH